MVLNHINVERSVVGSINTGNVHTIDVNISVLKTAGSDQLGEAIKQLAEVIANEHSFSPTQKNDLLDQVAFLSEQTVAPTDKRRPGMIKSALETVGKVADTVTKVGAAWVVVKPMLKAAFGF